MEEEGGPDGKVVDHLLHLLQVVLDRVELLPQVVVLQVEQPGGE